MPNETAEQAALKYAQAVLAGDMPTVLRYLSPDALGQQLEILGRSYFRYLSYDVALHAQEGDDHVFDITYQTDDAPITLRNRFRLDGDAWRIIELTRPDGG
ncbi:MAG: hypothetical protein WEE64_14275 [Dehalococcoidia bacterium]